MWIHEHSKHYTNVKPETIWALWQDIDNWPKWHSDLEYCKLEGNFEIGSQFVLKPKSGPKVKIKLTEMEKGKSFTDCTAFIGAKMYDEHRMEIKDGGILISNKLVVTGPLRWIWIKLVANGIARSVPEEMDKLVRTAQAMESKES